MLVGCHIKYKIKSSWFIISTCLFYKHSLYLYFEDWIKKFSVGGYWVIFSFKRKGNDRNQMSLWASNLEQQHMQEGWDRVGRVWFWVGGVVDFQECWGDWYGTICLKVCLKVLGINLISVLERTAFSHHLLHYHVCGSGEKVLSQQMFVICMEMHHAWRKKNQKSRPLLLRQN